MEKMGKFNRMSKEEFMKAYACAKGCRTRRIKIVRHMDQGLSIKFDLSNYNRLQEELIILDHLVYSMKDISKHSSSGSAQYEPDQPNHYLE